MQNFTKIILRKAALPATVAGILMTIIFTLTEGLAGAIGAILGTVIVVPFFLAGQVLLARVLAANPTMAMGAAMGIYLAKIGGLAVLLFLLKDVSVFNPTAFALTVVICTLVWTAAEMWYFATSKVLYVEPGSGPASVNLSDSKSDIDTKDQHIGPQ